MVHGAWIFSVFKHMASGYIHEIWIIFNKMNMKISLATISMTISTLIAVIVPRSHMTKLSV